MEKLCSLLKKHKEIIMYLIFGVATTVVSLVSYALFVELFSLGITASSALSWVLAVTFAFVTNKLFVFESRGGGFCTILREAVSFLAARALSGAVDIFLPELLYKVGLDASFFGVEGFVAKIVVNIIVIVMNYVLSRFFVFQNKK